MVAAGTVLVKSRGATQSIYQSRNTWDFSKQQRKGSGWSQIETHVIKKDWERKIWVVGLWETNFTKSAHFFVSQEQKILSLLILQKVFYWLKWPKLHLKNIGTLSSHFQGQRSIPVALISPTNSLITEKTLWIYAPGEASLFRHTH